MSRRTLPLLLAAVIALAGCGLRDPYSQQPQKRPAAGDRSAQTPAPQGAPKPATSATSVLARYAEVWVNWSAATLAHERAALLALATGRLAQQLRQDAAQAVKTQLQEVSQSYSRGRYVGVIREAAGTRSSSPTRKSPRSAARPRAPTRSISRAPNTRHTDGGSANGSRQQTADGRRSERPGPGRCCERDWRRRCSRAIAFCGSARCSPRSSRSRSRGTCASLRPSPDARPAGHREHGGADRRQQRPRGSHPAVLCGPQDRYPTMAR